MNNKPHSEEEIVKFAKLILAKESVQGSNKTVVSVILPHADDGVSYGYDVHFKRNRQANGNLEWELDFICNVTSPQ